MPGIVGRIGGNAPQRAETSGVLDKLRHFPFYESGCDSSDRGWLGWVGIGQAGHRVGRDASGRHLVVYHGDGAARGAAARVEDLVANIADRPADLGDRLGGSFAVACLNLESGEFHCLTDRFGHHRVYYLRDGAALYVVPELKGCFGWPDLSVVADDQALRDLVNYTYPLGDRTSLAGVKLLPPASHLSFRDGVERVERYWQPLYRPQEGDDDQLCEEGHQLFVEAFAEKTADRARVVIPVSGGLDSRLLLGRALAEAKEILPYTYGHARSREAAVACAAMRDMGVTPRHIQTDEFVAPADSVRRGTWFGEGMVNAAIAGLVMVQSHLMDEPRTSLFVTGIYGGPTNFSNTYHKPEELVENMTREQKVAHIGATMFSHQMRTPGNYRKLRPEFAQTCRESYDREIERLLGEHERVSPLFGHQKDAFYIANRMCRFMNQVDVNRHFWDEAIPLTSTRLYDFYLRLPERLKARRLLHRRILARYYPAAARSAVYSSGLTVLQELAGETPRVIKSGGSTYQHFLGRLTRGRYNPPDIENYRSYDYIYRRNRGLRRFYEDVLGDPYPLAEDVFDFTVVREYLRKCRQGAALYGALTTIMAWELWLRQIRARRWDV